MSIISFSLRETVGMLTSLTSGVSGVTAKVGFLRGTVEVLFLLEEGFFFFLVCATQSVE
ncbi:MAG: hypothetical protein ACRCY6_05255 [Bacteroidales bacterium]